MTLFVSFFVILLVAAAVGRVCSSSRPGDRPGVEPQELHLPDTGQRSGRRHHRARTGD